MDSLPVTRMWGHRPGTLVAGTWALVVWRAACTPMTIMTGMWTQVVGTGVWTLRTLMTRTWTRVVGTVVCTMRTLMTSTWTRVVGTAMCSVMMPGSRTVGQAARPPTSAAKAWMSGDCGLIPCMCGPTPQVIPVSAGETVAEVEVEAGTEGREKAVFKARDEL